MVDEMGTPKANGRITEQILRQELTHLGENLTAEIARTNERLYDRLDMVEGRLTAKINQVEVKFDERINGIERSQASAAEKAKEHRSHQKEVFGDHEDRIRRMEKSTVWRDAGAYLTGIGSGIAAWLFKSLAA